MSLFDLLFLAVFLASALVPLAVVASTLRGRKRRAVRLLAAWIVTLAVYFTVLVAVSLNTPQRVLEMKTPQCSGDWCIAVEEAQWSAPGDVVTCTVTLRLFSRSRTRTPREKRVDVYLVDARGHRYPPQEDTSSASFDTALDPGQSILTTRTFRLPADVQEPGLVVAHGWFPRMFVIADGHSLLHRPPVVRLR
jgi:hypothetical protein